MNGEDAQDLEMKKWKEEAERFESNLRKLTLKAVCVGKKERIKMKRKTAWFYELRFPPVPNKPADHYDLPLAEGEVKVPLRTLPPPPKKAQT